MSSAGRSIQSIEVGGRILTALVNTCAPMMLRDLAQMADLPPAQCHAYLTSYRNIGLVEQDPQTGHYRLGGFAMRLGIGFLRSDPILAAAGEAIKQLSQNLGHMALMLVWGPHGPTIVQVQEGTLGLPLNIRQGTLFSVTGTASGLIFAAFGKQDGLQEMIAQELDGGDSKVSVGLIPEPTSFKSQVATTRKRGYALAVGVPLPGINAVSAPVFNGASELALAVTIIGREEELSVEANSPALVQLLAKVKAVSEGAKRGTLPASQ
ncbi:IclR family transcriptional regulator [Ferrovibrio sp.]|uniref:IclR family transcriptional regulator n=1 Tax=Ferrovibrio sp. TaxID=1917215 RepID=UPI00311E0D4B